MDISQKFQRLAVDEADFPPDQLSDMMRGLPLPAASGDAPSIKPLRVLAPDARYHLLHYEFPSFRLLPDNAQPVFEEPRHIHSREPPRKESMPFVSGSLSYSASLETLYSVTTASAPDLQKCGNLSEVIARLRKAPGFSSLEFIASQHNAYQPVMVHMRVSTWWTTASGFSECESICIVCGLSDWLKCLKLRRTEPWANLLRSLFLRADEYSYYHVDTKLKAYDSHFAQNEHNKWLPEWGRDRATVVREGNLVLQRLRAQGVLDCDNDMIQRSVLLPSCGCVVVGSRIEWGCLGKCSECGTFILTQDEHHKVSFTHDYDMRRRFERFLHGWLEIAEDQQQQSSQQIETTNLFLRIALQTALLGLKVPSSVVSYHLNPADFMETRLISDELQRQVPDNQDKITLIKGTAIQIMERIALQALEKHYGTGIGLVNMLPLQYPQFLSLWFEQALLMASVYGPDQLALWQKRHEKRVQKLSGLFSTMDHSPSKANIAQAESSGSAL